MIFLADFFYDSRISAGRFFGSIEHQSIAPLDGLKEEWL